MTTMTTRNDLKNWVSSHSGDHTTEAEWETITAAIQAMDHPAWGDDWTEFLESLDLDALEGVDQRGNISAIDDAFRQYRTTNKNPCGGCGYYDEGEELPYRVHFCDGVSDESFATLAEAIEAASDYADEMDAEQGSELLPD